MVAKLNFQSAVNVLDHLTSSQVGVNPKIQFGMKHKDQHPITAALKILHKAALEGSDEQKAELLKSRHKMKALNRLLRSSSFNHVVKDRLDIEMGDEANKLQGMQVALPKTKFQKMMSTITKIPRIIMTILSEIIAAPCVFILLLLACAKTNFNPKPHQVKKNQIPILLLHGSGFNESEWIFGRQFLRKKEYGSVFSLNLDGKISNDPNKGIEDYAQEKVRDEVKRIRDLTGCDKVILMGHSMGGMIAGYYAEHFSKDDGIKAEHVISLASPWHGAPLVDRSWKIGGIFAKRHETKRHQQMSVSGGTASDPTFRRRLVAKALDSERKGLRKYYSLWSTTDYAVPKAHGDLTEDPRRQRSFNFLGHYSIAAWPGVWLQTRAWLDEIYAAEKSA